MAKTLTSNDMLEHEKTKKHWAYYRCQEGRFFVARRLHWHIHNRSAYWHGNIWLQAWVAKIVDDVQHSVGIMAQGGSREERLGITADRLTQHHEYYVELSNAVGIGWRDLDARFMGKTLDYWKKKYAEDKHLRNHPLSAFEAYYPMYLAYVEPVAGSWSMYDTVCCLKAVIRQKIFDSEIGKGDHGK